MAMFILGSRWLRRVGWSERSRGGVNFSYTRFSCCKPWDCMRIFCLCACIFLPIFLSIDSTNWTSKVLAWSTFVCAFMMVFFFACAKNCGGSRHLAHQYQTWQTS